MLFGRIGTSYRMFCLDSAGVMFAAQPFRL
jgi:hypothetical protein